MSIIPRLSACALAAVLSLNTPAFCTGVDYDVEKLKTPTLDVLAGEPIPGTNPPKYYPNSSYTLTEINEAANNSITKYLLTEDGTTTPKYFQLGLKQTEYGEGDGAKYYKWDKTDGLKLVETTDPTEAQITAKYDTNSLYSYTEIDSINSVTDVTGGSFVGLDEGGIYIWDSVVNIIDTDFIGNNTKDNGGAILIESGTISKVAGNFIGNCSSNSYVYNLYGGAIYNNYRGIIDEISSNFIGNYVESTAAFGGAIANENYIGDISGNFIANSARAIDFGFGGAIYNTDEMGDITGDFIANGVIASTDEPAIDINGTIMDIEAHAAYGGAICNDGLIGNVTGDFIGNYAKGYFAQGGAINTGAYIGTITGDFINNRASGIGFTTGGAISNFFDIVDNDFTEIKNSSFINNIAESEKLALGGAVFSTYNLAITADNGQSIFSGNKTITNGVTEQNAIGVYGRYATEEFAQKYGLPSSGFITEDFYEISDKNPVTLTLKAENNGVIVFNDTIRGGAIDAKCLYLDDLIENEDLFISESPETAFTLNITGDKTGQIYLQQPLRQLQPRRPHLPRHHTSRRLLHSTPNLQLRLPTLR